ncbi:MAG: hypothetical protein DRI01_03150 [Chloroflexi bacterium]|nr:MAG: hypothetical protein DRI01_03150 [Chloroflexota bacterium]
MAGRSATNTGEAAGISSTEAAKTPASWNRLHRRCPWIRRFAGNLPQTAIADQYDQNTDATPIAAARATTPKGQYPYDAAQRRMNTLLDSGYRTASENTRDPLRGTEVNPLDSSRFTEKDAGYDGRPIMAFAQSMWSREGRIKKAFHADALATATFPAERARGYASRLGPRRIEKAPAVVRRSPRRPLTS